MTDAEAIKYADGILASPEFGGLLERFARHALQAIEDRAALVSGWTAYNDGTGYAMGALVKDARRHMRGEP